MDRGSGRAWLASSALIGLGISLVVQPAAGYADTTAAARVAPATTDRALHADFNGDGYADLLVGLGSSANAVQVVYGSASGLAPATAKRFSQNTRGVPGASEDGDLFGMAVAVGNFNGDHYTDAVIGAPGESVGTKSGAGAVTVLYGSSSGLRGTGARTFSQDTRGVAESAERGDRFGTSLTVRDFNGDKRDDVAIGVPGERPGSSSVRSGAVEVLYGSSTGLAAAGSRVFSRKTAGMTDTATTGGGVWGAIVDAGDFNGDHFGDLAIGVPGGYYKSVKHAGFVQLLYGSHDGITRTGARRVTRATAGVPGSPGQGLPFGLRLAAGDFNGDARSDLAVNDVALWGSSNGVTGSGSRALPIPTDFTVQVLRAGDITGDKRADLLVGGRTGHDAAFVVAPGAAGGFASDVQTTAYPAQPPPDQASDLTHNVTDLVVLRAAGSQQPPVLVTTDAGFEVDWSSGAAYVFRGASVGIDQTPVLSLTKDNTKVPFTYQPAPLA